MRTGLALWLIWCCFLARAWFYCAAVPLWEGYDEYSHFALIQYVFNHHGRFPLDAVAPDSSRAVSASRRLTPGPWLIHDARGGILSYEEYFDLPAAERNARRAQMESLPAEWSRAEADPPEPIYEAQQPPLYYWIMAPFYGMVHGSNLPNAVWVLRFLTGLMASAAIPLAFFSAKRVMRNDAMAMGAAVMVASLPQLFIQIGHIGNEGLAVATGGLFVFVAFRTLQTKPSLWAGLGFGAALGAALLTKAYFLALLPAAAIFLWSAWRREAFARGPALWQACAAVCSSAAIAGWWYVHNLIFTGSLTGQIEDIQGMANTQVSLLSAIRQIHWTRIFDVVATSQIWLGGWSFLSVRSWMYRLVELIVIVAIAGVCTQTLRPRPELPRPRDLWLLALPYLTMVAGLCFHAAQVFRTSGIASTPGYYLYALVVPEAILLVAGLARITRGKWRLLPLPVAALILIAMEQFGMWFLMLPYYAGFIRHLPSGALPAARVAQYRNGGVETLFHHLSAIGPVSVPAVIEINAVLHFLTTAFMLWYACHLSFRTLQSESKN